MKIAVTGRGIQVLDNVREYAEQKAGKLERFDDQLQKVEVILSTQGDDKVVEMIAVPRKGKQQVVAQSEHEDVFAAVDLVVDKMSQQLRKAKEKQQDRRKRSGRVPPPPEPSDLVEDEDENLESYDEVVEKFSEKLDAQ